MGALDRVAVVSDVHGNLTAYEAVLADIDARGITRVVNLGDVVGKGPRGAACVALTQERCEATVRILRAYNARLAEVSNPDLPLLADTRTYLEGIDVDAHELGQQQVHALAGHVGVGIGGAVA